jgi:hypothetical protein
MHREPSARYLNAIELAREIRRSSGALPAPENGPAAPRAENNWRALFVGACVLVVVAIAGAMINNQRASSRLRQTQEAMQETQDANAALERERDIAIRRAADMETARESVEAELDRTHATLTQTQSALETARKKQAPPTAPASRPDVGDPAAAPEAPPAKSTQPTPPSLTPATSSNAATETPGSGEEVLPTNVVRLPATTQEAPNARKQEILAAITSLVASLEEAPGPDGKTEVRLHATDPDRTADMEMLGFRDGDVVTQINRTAVESIDTVKSALKHVDKDPGFSVRVLRDGQAAWIRVSYAEEPPKPAPVPPAPADVTAIPGEEQAPEEASPAADVEESESDQPTETEPVPRDEGEDSPSP